MLLSPRGMCGAQLARPLCQKTARSLCVCALAGLWARVGGAAILSHTFGRRAHCEGVERNIGKGSTRTQRRNLSGSFDPIPLPSAPFVMEIIKMKYKDATRNWPLFFDQ